MSHVSGIFVNCGVVLTFPDACPQNVAVIHVEHDPLAVERIFIDRATQLNEHRYATLLGLTHM